MVNKNFMALLTWKKIIWLISLILFARLIFKITWFPRCTRIIMRLSTMPTWLVGTLYRQYCPEWKIYKSNVILAQTSHLPLYSVCIIYCSVWSSINNLHNIHLCAVSNMSAFNYNYNTVAVHTVSIRVRIPQNVSAYFRMPCFARSSFRKPSSRIAMF